MHTVNTRRHFFTPAIQPKLTVNAPNDIYEKEADAVADQVMRMPHPQVQRQSGEEEEIMTKKQEPAIQRTCEGCEAEKLQRQPAAEEEEKILKAQPPTVQRACAECEREAKVLQTKESSSKTPNVRSPIESSIYSQRGECQFLTRSSQGFLGSHFGIEPFHQTQQEQTHEELQRQLIPYSYTPTAIRESEVTNNPEGLSQASLEDLFILYGAAWRLHRLLPSRVVYSQDWVLSSEGITVIHSQIRAKLFAELDQSNRREGLLSYVERMRGVFNRKNEIRNMINEVFARVSTTSGARTRFSRFLNTGSGITEKPLGVTDVLLYKLNGVELQFEVDSSDLAEYRNVRPVQWLGPDVIYSKSGDPLRSSWQRINNPEGGSGWDNPSPENVVRRRNIIAYYDSPGPSLSGYYGTDTSRLHVAQNFVAWIVGEPLSGGVTEQLCRRVSWYSVVSLFNRNFDNPEETGGWERFPGNRSGIGRVDTNTPPEF